MRPFLRQLMQALCVNKGILMDEQVSILTILVAIATSVIGSVIVFYYLRFRNNQIRKKIEDIESEESFLEKLSKGNIKLLRSTFVVILLAMFLGFTAASIVLASNAFGFEGNIEKYSYGLSAWLLFLAAGLCFQQFRSIVRLADLNKTKQKFKEKKEHLKSKLNT